MIYVFSCYVARPVRRSCFSPRARFHAFLRGVYPGFHCGVHLVSALDRLHSAESYTAVHLAWFLGLEFEEILTGYSLPWKDTYYH